VGVCTGIGEIHRPTVQVWPNPSPGIFHLQIQEASGQPLQIEVVNLQGKQVLAANPLPGADTELDLSGVAAGIYLLRINTESGMQVMKLVKE
jgi:hypothetical protein